MTTIKLNLVVFIQGIKTFSEAEYSSKNAQNKIEMDMTKVKTHTMVVDKKPIRFVVGKNKLVRQSLNVFEEAYKQWISNEVPAGYTKSEWFKLSKLQKIAAHCQLITHDLHGVGYNYQIFED